MSFLQGHQVLALGSPVDAALPRYLASLGATVDPISLGDLATRIADASFLLDELGLVRLQDAGWPRSRIEDIAPRLIHVSVTPFGSDAPRARWLGGELIASAMGGILRLTGEPDRAPVKEALDACWFHADMVAAAGVLAAHFERGTSGRGQHVDVSVQEVALSRQVNSILVWQFDRRKLARVGGALNYGLATVRCIWTLSDGWCFHTLMTGRFGAPANRALSDWIDEVGMPNPLQGVDWTTYNRSTLAATTRAAWEAAIAAFFRTRTREEVRVEGLRRGINATVVLRPADVLADPHLRARQFWETRTSNDPARAQAARHAGVSVPRRFVAVTLGEAGGSGSRAPKPEPVTMGEAAGPRVPKPEPSARESSQPAGSGPLHGVRVLDARVPKPETSARDSSQQLARGGPLRGVRVLDFSWALVGSVTTKTLGDLGADVIKVESRTRPCLTRIDVQVSASKAGNFDDKPWFAHLNSSKRSLALDIKVPESREVLNPLIEWADVVVENFSPGTMAKLGLDYQALVKSNPSLIMVSGSVYGQTGPLAQEWGIDGTGGALSGRTYLTGWPDRAPVIPGAVPYGDVIVPYAMAAAVAAALQYRRETGRGAHVDASMYEICVQQMYGAIVQAQTAVAPERDGNRDSRIFHQGVYPVQGDDRWIAISLPTADDWQRLRSLAALPDAGDIAGRDAAIGAWSRDRVGPALAILLQEAGIAAGVLQDIEDLLESDPQIAARGSLMPIEHPLLGRFGHMRSPLTFSRSVATPYRAPGIGEHSAAIAAEIGGLDRGRIEELAALGVFR